MKISTKLLKITTKLITQISQHHQHRHLAWGLPILAYRLAYHLGIHLAFHRAFLRAFHQAFLLAFHRAFLLVILPWLDRFFA
jgi:hypothetical protein